MFRKIDDLNSIISSLLLLGAVFIFPYSYLLSIAGLVGLVLELIIETINHIPSNKQTAIKSWCDARTKKIIEWSEKHKKLNILYIVLITLFALNCLNPSYFGIHYAKYYLLLIALIISDCVFISKIMAWLKKNKKSKNTKHLVLTAIIAAHIISAMLIFTMPGALYMILWFLLFPLHPIFDMFDWFGPGAISGLMILFISIYGMIKKVKDLNIFLTKLTLLLLVIAMIGWYFNSRILLILNWILPLIAIFRIIKKGKKIKTKETRKK